MKNDVCRRLPGDTFFIGILSASSDLLPDNIVVRIYNKIN